MRDPFEEDKKGTVHLKHECFRDWAQHQMKLKKFQPRAARNKPEKDKLEVPTA